MVYEKTLDWDDLPHDDMVGHGREGLVLRLDKTRCIKIYSPERASIAETEFENYKILRDANLLVPEPEELVKVGIKGRKVKLPGRCELRGIGLYNVSNIESVPGIIKEFFPGAPYGSKRPSIKEISGLIEFLDKLHEAGLTFDDGIAPDFISSRRGTALVDCSTLMDRVQCEEKYCGGFQYASSSYKDKILVDLVYELRQNCRTMFGLDFKLTIVKWLSERKK